MPALPMPTRPPSPPGLGPLLFDCARLLDDVAQAEVNREAGARVLTPALVRLLPHLTTAGIRPTALARRVEVSKQAVGQLLGDLESRGFVELVPDPDDGRARLVRLTPAGLAAFDHGRGVLAFYEAALATRVGQVRIDTLRDTLGRVLPVLVEWAAGEAPQRKPAETARRGRRRPRPKVRQ